MDFEKWKEEDDSDVEGGGDAMNFGNFDLSQYTSQMGGMGGEAPDLGDFEDDDEDDEEPPALENEEEVEGKAGSA